MSLYDDLDVKTKATENVSGWSSGIKLLQSQLQLKKAAVTQPKREQQRKASLAPVIDLKSRKEDDEASPILPTAIIKQKTESTLPVIPPVSEFPSEYDWNVIDEYDPLWPNEYEKVVKELRESRDRESEKEEKRRERSRRKSRFADTEDETISTPQMSLPLVGSGFAGKNNKTFNAHYLYVHLLMLS